MKALVKNLHIGNMFGAIRRHCMDLGLYRCLTLAISGLASIAAVATAIVSWKTMDINTAERREVDALQREAVFQREALSNALERTCLYGDILSAAGGDRFAYMRACEAVRVLPDKRESEHLDERLHWEMSRFLGEVADNQVIQREISGPFPLELDVERSLVEASRRARLFAINYVFVMRLNKYVPMIVDCLKEEPDLNVVQLAVEGLNSMLFENRRFGEEILIRSYSLDDCVFRYDEFKNHFVETWTLMKDRILSRKPKEVREGKDKNNLQVIYIFDPEKPEDIPVVDK